MFSTLAFAAFSCAFIPAASAQNAQKKPDVYDPVVPKPTASEARYGKHERHVLDFWKADSETPVPLVFIIHGGGWKGGSKERSQLFADITRLLKSGLSVAAINYRYMPQAVEVGIEPPVKAPLHDAALALQFVRSKAAEWNIDKTTEWRGERICRSLLFSMAGISR